MKSLIAKIEENARRSLILPPLSKPSDELKRYRQFLKIESHRLLLLHRGGTGGLEVCQGRAAMMDVLVRYIWEATLQVRPCVGKPPKIALVAFGGYGRGELNPYSDIDLMFLHETGIVPQSAAETALTEWTSGLLYTLWDIGLKVGHAVRSVEDCVEVANQDMQAKTAMIETRQIAGDQPLFRRLQRTVGQECIRGYETEYIKLRLADQATRRTKYGNSPAMQEPNIKNGVGGLRDYQNLLWMALVKYRTRSLLELQEEEFLNAPERKQLETAYDFLLRARTELHYVAGRSIDALTANLKPAVAYGLGYHERSPRIRTERFMRDYYTHTRNLYLITRTLEQRMALVPSRARETPKTKGEAGPHVEPAKEFDGFRIVEGQLHFESKNLLKEDSGRLLRAFLEAQRRGLQLHPDLAQLLRQQIGLVDRAFVADPHHHATFLEILNQRGNVAPFVRAMHEVGLLGKFLPEFAKLTNLVQHEYYHQYAVDEHTLHCVAKLDEVWRNTGKPYSNYTDLFRSLDRPFVLYLALLLHDAGKAYDSGRHEVVGAELAMKAARRFRLDGATTHSLCLIIAQHLAMVQVSQRRDLEDATVIAEFATAIQTKENLDLLTLHTFADSMGTSDTLWNGFKDSLLWQLYHKAARVLVGGTDFIRAEKRQRELLRAEVQAILPRSFAADEIDAHFDGLPSRYFPLHSARDIARDLSLAHRFMHLQLTEEDRALEPVIVWSDERDRGCSLVIVCTWDRAGLFSKLTGALTAAGLNILSAQIFTRSDGIVLDSFQVVDARTGEPPEPGVRERFEKWVLDVLAKGVDLRAAISRTAQVKALYQAPGEERLPVQVRVEPEVHSGRTLIEIITEDRVGLLYALSQALADLELNLVLAKIVTEKGAAIDTFYVTEVEGEIVIDPQRCEAIAQRLRAVAGPVKKGV
ncbi:MAG TPA: [protein-PII] uridylyltransferase [Candidatus Limnocylindria bacterium]|nr:[protein-PII] uridylyltransferase [Candidatus Limnocylindria bacterium]